MFGNNGAWRPVLSSKRTPVWCGLPQDPREKRVTLDEAPSGVYLYPEEELGADSIFSSSPGKPSGTVFEEAQKEILTLMKIEVSRVSSRRSCDHHTHRAEKDACIV